MLSECAFYSSVTLYCTCMRDYLRSLCLCALVLSALSTVLCCSGMLLRSEKKKKEQTFGHFKQAGY